MTKALILVKSPRSETYEAVINQLLDSNRGITEITWAYLNIPVANENSVKLHYPHPQ